MNNKGFTLIELLASLVILGLLMGVAIPTVVNMINDLIGNKLKLDKPFKYISKQTIRNIVLTSNTAKENYI